jgi:hypothetical protein
MPRRFLADVDASMARVDAAEVGVSDKGRLVDGLLAGRARREKGIVGRGGAA